MALGAWSVAMICLVIMVASPVFFRVTGQHLCRPIRDGLCDSFTIRNIKGQQNSHVAHAGHYAVSIGQLRQIVKIFPGVLNAGLSRSFQKFRRTLDAAGSPLQYMGIDHGRAVP